MRPGLMNGNAFPATTNEMESGTETPKLRFGSGRSQSNASTASVKEKQQKRVSAGDGASQQSFKLQNHLIQSVKKSIAKTKKQWDKTGSIHVIYVIALLAYSFLGGLIFKYLDGPQADQILHKHKTRCASERDTILLDLAMECRNKTFLECQHLVNTSIHKLDRCFRSAPQVPFNHSTSDYWNSLIYAITVYTTIGYGNVVVLSTEGRLAMIVYAMIGIPLFFAFLNDMGQWFHCTFLRLYELVRRRWKKSVLFRLVYTWRKRRPSDGSSSGGSTKTDSTKGRRRESNSDREAHDGLIFTLAVGVLIFYLIAICCLFMGIVNGQWNFLQSFYFVFQSISLIGFGDEFPENPKIVLMTIAFIIVGIILLSMCFFILQEWIRGKTYRLSNQVRRSVRRWRHQKPASGSVRERRTARFTAPLRKLSGLTGQDKQLRRIKKADDRMAGQRLAAGSDYSPKVKRRSTAEECHLDVTDSSELPTPTTSLSGAPALQVTPSSPKLARKEEPAVGETPAAGETNANGLFPMGLGLDSLMCKPLTSLLFDAKDLKRLNRRHTVLTVDQEDEEEDENDTDLEDHKKRDRRSTFFSDPEARFGKFQWMRRRSRCTDDEDEEEEEEESSSAAETQLAVEDASKQKSGAHKYTERDEFL